jgi:hypothetical protein
MTYSEAAWEANRRNAARSTGPKTPEGKAASSRNAVKHGLTANEILLAHENRDAYDARLQTWLDHDQPTDPGHVAAIERLVYTQFRLDRCTRHETETTKQRVLHAAGRFDADELASAYTLGRRLIDDPIQRDPDAGDFKLQVIGAKHDRWFNDEPAVLLLQLQSTAQGVDWLLARWRELLQILESELSWNFYYQNRAIRLLGKRVDDLFDDLDSRQIILAAYAAGKGEPSWGLAGQAAQSMGLVETAEQSVLRCEGRVTDGLRINYLMTLAPESPEKGREILRGIINDEIDRLMHLRRVKQLDELAQSDRDGAEDRALIDVSHAGVLLRRYETATEREFHKTLAEIRAYRKASAASVRNEPIPQPARNPQVASTPPPPPASHPASTDQGSPISAPTITQVPALPIPRRK